MADDYQWSSWLWFMYHTYECVFFLRFWTLRVEIRRPDGINLQGLMNTYSTPWASQWCWQLSCAALVPGHAWEEPTRPSCFLGNCLVSYGVMPKIRHLSVGKKGLCSFRQAVWPLTTWLGHLEIVPVKSGPALLQKILIHANTMQTMQSFMNYSVVCIYFYSWWRSQLLFGKL